MISNRRVDPMALTRPAHGPLVCDDPMFLQRHVPDIVVTVGRVGLFRSVASVIAQAGMHVAVDSRSSWSDPTRTADLVLAAVPLPPSEADTDPQWWAAWERADLMAAAAVETVLGSRRSSMSGMEVARTVAACLGEARSSSSVLRPWSVTWSSPVAP